MFNIGIIKLRLRNLLIVLLLIFILPTVDAAVVGASPSILRFDSMLRGGYAEASVVVSTSFVQPVQATVTAEGEIAEWISYRPDETEFMLSRQDAHSFTVIIEPPEDTPSGNYSGTLRLTTDELALVEEGAGSSVIAQVAILIYVEVTGDEIVDCRAGAIRVTNAEVGEPFIVMANVNNDGNVRLRPEVRVDVYDQYQTQVLFSDTLYGSQILPTLRKEILVEVENDLDLGQYFARVYFDECGISQLVTFDVVERGQISDSGTLVGIRSNDVVNVNEPMAIEPIFRNNGQRKVFATFKGEVQDLRRDRIEQVLESEELEVNPGATINWRLFFTPRRSGEYQITGRVVYNNKVTFEEYSKVVTAKGSEFGIRWILFILLYLIIGLVILILIGKIRKAQKKNKF